MVEFQKKKNGNNGHKKRNYHKALDSSKEGQKLQPVEDLHAQNLQPVRELVSDHFERQVAEIQNGIIQPVIQLPCDILEKQVNQIERRQILIEQKVDSHGDIKPTITITQSIERQQVKPNLIQIKTTITPEDKQYDYDILPRPDYYLIYAAHNLLQIHKRFFTNKKQEAKLNQKKLSFGQINRKLKMELLAGNSVKFCMKNQTKIDVYWRSIKLGCQVLSPESETQPQYIIRLNRLKSNISRMYYKKEQQEERNEIIKQQSLIEMQTLKQLKFYAQTMKIPIVSESWIQFCYSFTYPFPVQPFIIDSDDIFKDVQEQEFEWVIEEHAQQLLKKIREKNQMIEKNRNNNSEKV